MQQLQWLHFTATLSVSSECVPFAKHRNGFLLQLTWGEAALTIIRARAALHPLTGIAHCLQSNQTDAHFFWKVDMSETEPLANALKLHFHLLLRSMFLLFRRKLFWILFRGCVSSEWAFTFLLFLPNDLTHHSTRNSPLTSGEVTDIVLSVFSMSESLCFLRCEASARRWLHLSLVVSLVHQGLFSLVLLGIRIITLFSRGFRIAASYCIIECFVEGEGEPWSGNVRSQSGKAVEKSPELKWSAHSHFSVLLTSCQASLFLSLALIMNSVKWDIWIPEFQKHVPAQMLWLYFSLDNKKAPRKQNHWKCMFVLKILFEIFHTVLTGTWRSGRSGKRGPRISNESHAVCSKLYGSI